MKTFLAIILMFISAQSYAQTCIPLHGLSFERVGAYTLLASRDGKNIALIDTYIQIPVQANTYRFFSDRLCNAGAEASFQVNGVLGSVQSIRPFK